MNNQELMQLFQSINKIDNCFERELALKNANKKYKKSQFYKQTHYSIRAAYGVFCANALNSVVAFVNTRWVQQFFRGNYAALQVELEHFIQGFDFTKLDGLFTYLEDKLNSLSVDNANLKIDFDKVVKEFQESLK